MQFVSYENSQIKHIPLEFDQLEGLKIGGLQFVEEKWIEFIKKTAKA